MNEIQKQVVRAVQHRMVDMELKANAMCLKAGVSESMWSEVANGKKSPGLEVMMKVANAVGLELTFRLNK